MTTLAWKNLVHDKVRLVVTLVGIVFALVLILIQFGLFLSFLDTSANIVAHSGADLWITAPKTPHVNGGSVLPESKRWRALAAPGVERVERHAVLFVNWKLPSGAQEAVQVVGFDPGSGMGGPWNVVAGAVADLRGEDTVVIDELYKEKLGVTRLGQTAEIAGRRARIVGFTRGIRSFTTTPYVFCTFKNSLNYMRLAEDQTIYFLVRLKRGAEPETVRQDLLAALGEVEVVTNDELHARTQRYWVLETGAGVTTLLGAVLGLIVGVVVVAQTIYAATVDHIREFGTLKAMGASNGRIYAVIMAQAAISAVMGYIVAIAIAWPVSHASSKSNAPIYLPPEVAGGALLLALAMCTGAALISIRKATSIEPAMVFRG